MVSYTLREHPRAKRINITVRRDGSVWVTKPRHVSMQAVNAFIVKCEHWIERMQEKSSELPKTSKVESSKRQYERYKLAARQDVLRRVARMNARYKFDVSNVIIRNQKARWGSCSHKAVLSFNYRILFLPDHLADYIIAHELCHLREMNHSQRFWKLVSLSIPDHKDRRKELRKCERGLL